MWKYAESNLILPPTPDMVRYASERSTFKYGIPLALKGTPIIVLQFDGRLFDPSPLQ